MARKITTAIGLIVVIVLGVLQVADAEAARSPEARLDCDHGTTGCAGMAGDFSTADGWSVETIQVVVTDVTTGAVVDVTSSGCEVTARDGVPHMVQIHCMIEGAALGIDGDITWSVLLNGATVWVSPVTPTRCDTPPTPPPTPGGVTPPETTTTTTTTTTTAPETPPPAAPPATTTTVAEEQPATDTTVVTAVSSTTGPLADTTTTTVATLVSPAGSEPPGDDTATEEILPVTGLSLGVIGGIGGILLLVGWAIEVRTRPRDI